MLVFILVIGKRQDSLETEKRQDATYRARYQGHWDRMESTRLIGSFEAELAQYVFFIYFPTIQLKKLIHINTDTKKHWKRQETVTAELRRNYSM